VKDFTNLPLFPRAYSTVAHLGRTKEHRSIIPGESLKEDIVYMSTNAGIPTLKKEILQELKNQNVVESSSKDSIYLTVRLISKKTNSKKEETKIFSLEDSNDKDS